MRSLTTAPLVWPCFRQRAVSHQRPLFSTSAPLLKSPNSRKAARSPPIQVVHHKYQLQKQEQQLSERDDASDSKELVPRPDEDISLETAHKVNVPLRVIPKAQITPNLRLSPKERMHIEQLTRAPPRPSAPPGTMEFGYLYHYGRKS